MGVTLCSVGVVLFVWQVVEVLFAGVKIILFGRKLSGGFIKGFVAVDFLLGHLHLDKPFQLVLFPLYHLLLLLFHHFDPVS